MAKDVATFAISAYLDYKKTILRVNANDIYLIPFSRLIFKKVLNLYSMRVNLYSDFHASIRFKK